VVKRDGWKRERGGRVPIYVYYKDGIAVGEVYKDGTAVGEVYKIVWWYWYLYGAPIIGRTRLLRDAKAKLLAALEDVSRETG
jgi:hypothetical protein